MSPLSLSGPASNGWRGGERRLGREDMGSSGFHANMMKNISSNQDEDYLKIELWRACAGPLVTVPRVGDLVFYFPQGHMEQIEALTGRDANQKTPFCELLSKILCRVVHIEFQAEKDTDEVFAQVSLLPEREEGIAVKKPVDVSVRNHVYSFCKTLTVSDTSTHGGFSVLKRHADECLPPLDMSQQPPAQMLVAKDFHGKDWVFRHIFRGYPKRHLLTTGWSTFVNSKKLVAGDTFIFLRGEKEGHCVGIRRAMKQQKDAFASLISGQSMKLGLLATASHAITTGTMFKVYYRPWTSPSQFIIPYDQYMESARSNYAIGTRFQMKFEGESGIERYMGTVIATGDSEQESWPKSKWRHLKVQWDEAASIVRPERVSPWEITPVAAKTPHTLFGSQSKRRRLHSPSPVSSVVDKNGSSNDPTESSPRYHGVLQGEEKMALRSTSFNAPEDAQNHSPVYESHRNLFHDDFTHKLHKSEPVTSISSSKDRTPEMKFSKPKETVDQRMSEAGFGNDVHSGATWKLFGVTIRVPVSPCAASFDDVHKPSDAHIFDTAPECNASESFGGQSCTTNIVASRSCTKVLKHGTAVGRSVDLSCLEGYGELSSELDVMFEFGGGLADGSKGWHIIYTDKEGDIKMIGDDPWLKFCSVVRKIHICPQEEIERLNITLLSKCTGKHL